MNTNFAKLVLGVLLSVSAIGLAGEPVQVNVDNFVRAETDMYLGGGVKDGALGKFIHRREPTSVDQQTIIRMNRDTLYSSAVFDLDAGPVTVWLPDAGKRFRSLMVLNQDHYVHMVAYDAGTYTVTKEKLGTRYAFAAVRTFVDPGSSGDMKQVHALQNAIKVDQPGGPGKFEAPNWDPASQKKVRDALLILSSTTAVFSGAFGRKEEVDPVRHLLGTAAGWGGNPDRDATYVGVTPKENDAKTPYVLTVKGVPVDGFWSVSVYNKEGFFEKNAKGAYSFNNVTAKRNADDSITIHFGGDEKAVNYLPITPGWNYTVRLYRPRKEILDGDWKFPDAQPIR